MAIGAGRAVAACRHLAAVQPHQAEPQTRSRHLDHAGEAALRLRPVGVRFDRCRPRLSVIFRVGQLHVVGVCVRAALLQPAPDERSVIEADDRRDIRPIDEPVAPEATMRGALQPLAVLSENFSVASGPLRSIQLRMTPLDETCSCGCALSGADGLVNGSTFSGQVAGFCGTVASKAR